MAADGKTGTVYRRGGTRQRIAGNCGEHEGECLLWQSAPASLATNCMNAVDTNVLIYAHDPRDPVKQNKAAALIASLTDGGLYGNGIDTDMIKLRV